MKSSKISKISPKKGNLGDVAHRTTLAIDFNKQNLLQDLKNWNEQLSNLDFAIDKIEKATKKEVVLKNNDLSKEFSDAQTKIERLNRDIEATQKRFNKAQVEFETKLLTPFEKGDFNKHSQLVLEETKGEIKKIQEIFESSNQILQSVSKHTLKNTQRLEKLTESVNKICLSDEVEEAVKINEKFNARLKTICEETAQFDLNCNDEPDESQKVTTATVLQLYQSHREGKKLLVQLQQNLHIQPPMDKEKGNLEVKKKASVQS